MSVMLKPIGFFMFICTILFFYNLVFIFITNNKVDIVSNEVALIVERNGSKIENSKIEISQLLSGYNTIFEVEYNYDDQVDFLDSVEVIVSTNYEYLGMDRNLEFKKRKIVMNKQMGGIWNIKI